MDSSKKITIIDIKNLKSSCSHIDPNSECEFLCYKKYTRGQISCLKHSKYIYHYGLCVQTYMNEYYECLNKCRNFSVNL